jgi:hypothetical protein
VTSERGAAPSSEIWRAGADGANATALIRGGLSMISGLSLDTIRSELFWSDQGRGVIEVASLDGQHRRQLPLKQVMRMNQHSAAASLVI